VLTGTIGGKKLCDEGKRENEREGEKINSGKRKRAIN